MKKYLLLFLFFPLVSFGEPFSIPYRVTWDSSFAEKNYTNNSDFVSSDLTSVQLRYLSHFVGVRFYTNFTFHISMASSPSATVKFTHPVFDLSSGKYTMLRELPIISAAYTTIAELYGLGFKPDFLTSSEHYVDLGSKATYIYINCIPIEYLTQAVLSTNDVYRSAVLTRLSSIDSSLSRLVVSVASIESIVGSLGSSGSSTNPLDRVYLDGTYNVVPASFHNSAAFDGLSRIDNGKFLLDILNSLGFEGDDVNDPVYQDPLFAGRNSGLSSFADSFFSQAAQAFLLDQSSSTPKYSNFNDALGDLSGNLTTLGSFSFSTPLTNALQALDGEWKEKVKENLQAVKDDITNRLDKSTWAGYVNKSTNDLDSISRSSSSTAGSASDIAQLLQNAQNGSGIRVDLPPGPYNVNVMNWPSDLKISLNKDSLDFMSETVGTIADKWNTWFDYWRSWNSDYYFPSLLEQSGFFYNTTNQLNRLLSVSNVLNDILVSITNLDLTVTNNISALLLDDYETFIDSSKYNDVVSSLPGDLAAALSSFGFADSSEYSGRWWVFQSANMALQSQLALTNAALSSILLNALSAIDDSDDSGGSLLSRWLSLIDSIPDPEEIQQSLADATNIVSNIGFERADALYATATQDLVSVVKGIYQDKSLPNSIRFVFIPAKDGRSEKFVDIPVGEHSSLWSIFRSGMAFAISVVTLLLFPKYVSWLVSHYTRLVERIIKSLHAYTHQ